MATTANQAVAVVAVAVIIVFGAVLGYLIVAKPISSHGSIKAIGCEVWANVNRTAVLSDINWGMLAPGDIAAINMWVQNTGNVNVNLTMNVSGWSPVNASQYLAITWSYTNATVKPFEMVPIQLQLAVSPSITGITSFNNTITIIAKEIP